MKDHDAILFQLLYDSQCIPTPGLTPARLSLAQLSPNLFASSTIGQSLLTKLIWEVQTVWLSFEIFLVQKKKKMDIMLPFYCSSRNLGLTGPSILAPLVGFARLAYVLRMDGVFTENKGQLRCDNLNLLVQKNVY